MMFVAYDVCRIMPFVAIYDVCRLQGLSQYPGYLQSDTQSIVVYMAAQKKNQTEEMAKVVSAACLEDGIDSIPCRTSYFVTGLFEEKY